MTSALDELTGRVARVPRVRRLAEERAHGFASLMRKSGRIGSPVAAASRSTSISIMLIPLTVPPAIVLAVTVSPWLILVASAPAFAYFLPIIELRDAAAKRAEGVDRELPFFSILVNVLGGAGIPLYSVLGSLATTEVFGAMKREAQVIGREVRVFGLNPVDAFEKAAEDHPSRKFGEFLLGYASKVRSGGDIPSYLSGESRALLQELEDSWTRYSSRVGVIGSLMVTMFGVVPLLLMIVGFFAPSASAVGLLAFAMVGVPVLGGMLVLLAGRMQPASDQPLAGDWRRALALSTLGVGVYLLTGLAWAGLATSVSVFFVSYGYSVRASLRDARETDESIPRFLKDLMEYRRQDYDLNRAVASISSRSRYSPAFDRMLKRLSSEVSAGTPLGEVRTDPGTKLSRMVFFVLGQMAYSGGGDVDTIFQLTRYSSKVVEMKGNAQAEMKPYLVLSYLTPIILVFGVAFVGGILGSYHLGSGSAHPVFATGQASAALIEASDLLVVTTAAALGVVGSKIMDMTVQNTLRAATNVLLAAAAVALVPGLNIAALLHSV